MSDNKPRFTTYFIPPAYVNQTIEYQNINKDPELRDRMTTFYTNKVIKWINNYKEFSKYKNMLSLLKTKKGYIYIYKLLHLFVKKTKTNWYDLQDNYYVIRDFMQYKLASHK